MLLELPGPIPLHFPITSLLNSMDHAPRPPWANSTTFTYELLVKSMDHAPGAPWANPFTFPY